MSAPVRVLVVQDRFLLGGQERQTVLHLATPAARHRVQQAMASPARSRLLATAALALLVLLWAFPRRTSGLDWTWTRKDTALELTYVGVQAVDWMQTRRFLAAGREEMNPLLGSRPARGQLLAYNLVTMAAHAAIARALPHPFREVWQLSWIGVETAQVGSNWRTAGGLRLQLP